MLYLMFVFIRPLRKGLATPSCFPKPYSRVYSRSNVFAWILSLILDLISSLLINLAHAKDEVFHNSLVELADCAQVEHRVDRADRVAPFPLVPNSCLRRKQFKWHQNPDYWRLSLLWRGRHSCRLDWRPSSLCNQLSCQFHCHLADQDQCGMTKIAT